MNDSRPLPPTEVGQRVILTSYGGAVAKWMVGCFGTVVSFNKNGFPVIELDHFESPRGTIVIRGTGHDAKTPNVTDRWGCAKRVDADGSFVRS